MDLYREMAKTTKVHEMSQVNVFSDGKIGNGGHRTAFLLTFPPPAGSDQSEALTRISQSEVWQPRGFLFGFGLLRAPGPTLR